MNKYHIIYTMNKYHIIYSLQQRWRYHLLGLERVWSDSGSVGNRYCSPYASYCWYTHTTTTRFTHTIDTVHLSSGRSAIDSNV